MRQLSQLQKGNLNEWRRFVMASSITRVCTLQLGGYFYSSMKLCVLAEDGSMKQLPAHHLAASTDAYRCGRRSALYWWSFGKEIQ